MERINQRGIEMLQYKTELSKDYPELVKKSLILALDQLVEHKVIDLDTYEYIRDPSTTVEMLREYLLTKKAFLKTDEEIFAEFEVIRNAFNKKLEERGINVVTESVIEKDAILAMKKFCINEQFTLEYFGVEEKDLLKLMKRRGFVEKFAVLRLTAIFRPFVQRVEYPKDLMNFDVSLVYFDKEENGYSIDIFFELPIEKVEKQERIEEMLDHIQTITQQAEAYFHERTIP